MFPTLPVSQNDAMKIEFRWKTSKSNWQPMDSLRIEFARSATKDLRSVDRQWLPKIFLAIESLSNEPRPIGCKKLLGSEHTYRIRIGDYRVIYDIQDHELVVYVVRIRHRRDVYR
jgi:mRNA interferase RelE/StbE